MDIGERIKNTLCWDESKMAKKKYTRPLTEFTLQEKPYVSIADSLEALYNRFLYSTHLSRNKVAPFNFTLLRTFPNRPESFRWLLGFDVEKAHNILQRKSLFSQYAPLILSNLKQKPENTYYSKILAHPSDFSDDAFLAAVFHVTYRFAFPTNLFAVGLVHSVHQQRKAKYYNVELCKETCSVAKVSLVSINDGTPQPQVDAEFYLVNQKLYHAFIHKWMNAIQGLDGYDYIYNIYFPVYDSDLPSQRALRGYLGIFCSTKDSRDKALEYFGFGENRPFKEINDAYKRGVHNYAVDMFKDWRAEGKVIDWWVHSIPQLHQWGLIELIDEPNPKSGDLFWVERRKCKISVKRLFERNAIASHIESSFFEQYSNKVLSLPVPSEVITAEDFSIQSPFLKERVRDIVSLLAALIRKRYILINEEKIKDSARKSAVAAVMARNMSHNIGSHVLSRLSTNQDFPFRVGWNTSQKITSLNSYLRTRMDFIAAISTSQPSITTSIRLYRDAMAYFKPLYHDREEITWQELLLDHISGIEDLKSDDIEITLKRNGESLDLESPGLNLDPSFACPNGLLGTHALYIIIENIIRNSAKHAFRKGKHRKLEITFEINDFEQNNELIELKIYDNLHNASLPKFGCTSSVLTEYINDKIGQSILNSEGNLRGEAWGLLEMKVCAAYLRKIGSEKLDDDFPLALLQAVNVDGNLGYKFYLYKPNQVLIVDAQNQCNTQASIHGIHFVNLLNFKKRITTNVQHHFLILVDPDESVLNLVKKYKKSLPVRIFTTNNELENFPFIALDELNKILAKTDVSELSVTRWLWKCWSQHVAKDAELFIRYGDDSTVAKWEKLGFSESSVSPQAIKNLNSNKRYVVLDRHGEIQKHYQKELEEKLSSGEIAYYQQLQLQQPTHNIITHLTDDRLVGERFVYNLIETGTTKVVILDERIQKLVEPIKERGDTSLPLKSRLERMNIIIPPKDKVDLDNPGICYRALTKWVNANLDETMFLIIHFGILEKLYLGDVHKMQKRFIKIEKAFSKVNIVLISGRGLPDQVSTLDARFLNYSQVARYVLEEISKYHLNKVLFAARRYQPWTNHS